MTKKEEGQIQIHTENIFPIIKKAVYSDHEIFLRELVSNAVDAIKKRKMASMSGECSIDDESKIIIKIDKENNTLTISDNGIGMSSDEIKRYINQVAFSSAEEFLQKYDKNKEEIIGHFGLGFYSSFMVSKQVEILTKSALNDTTAIKWSCDGSPNFTLEEIDKDSIGTDIILYLLDEEKEYIEPSRIRNLISKYCDFMPVEIQLEGELINKMDPPWRKSPKSLEDKDYIDFYKYLYPFQGDPLFWIHLNTDYPYNLQGILFFPKITGRADWENGEIKLYSNQVYVSDSVKEIVPRYLLPLRGVIDSTDIPLNVSRSALQSDRRVKSIGNFISKKIADKLKDLKSEKPSFYCDIWESISPFIKIGAMEDEKFADQVEDLIIYKTLLDNKDSDDLIINKNETFTTVSGYRSRLDDSAKKILYYTDESSQASALSIWRGEGAEVLKADTVIDTQFISWLESRNENNKFQRVDAEIIDNKDSEKAVVNEDGNTEIDLITNLFKEALNNEKVSINIKSLKSTDSPPCIILLPEQMRRISDIGALMDQKLPGLPENHVLVINQNHPLVQGLLKLKTGSIIVGSAEASPTDTLSKEIANHLYDMAKSSIGGLEPNEITKFNCSSANLMATLLSRSI